MQLTIAQVFAAVPTLDTIILEKRPMPQVAKYRLARMYGKLLAEFTPANAQRDDLVRKHGDDLGDGSFFVPPERMAEFNAEWLPIAEHVLDVDIEPIRLSALGTPDDPNGAIEASELLSLGDLVIE